jgi:hypothetical protein
MTERRRADWEGNRRLFPVQSGGYDKILKGYVPQLNNNGTFDCAVGPDSRVRLCCCWRVL